ncbi:hypothetical protein [Alicyclobacillus acidoterrestris]|uniref:Uncharacterized protein n=1 Tax=Alicyclobacillus acidoterrestris (strain ATCC 49025 / DSM 3922 / CIP 106132 / NCIMB 13137 / GD3B) TaxID=1356854 RepID=T0CX80_ALIAG|nr:hypothetical protein [Alicyclobacillus acidoterrestris]EPZ43987.1 hypothetical protein N007_11865 [Alicyclobacillus acidoterrestris ATCC 49025]UNO50562.1 hypothetical protein K1I37_09010 [Alicyclobacillus acidoterrestris]
MGMFRLLFRMFRLFSMIYTVFRGSRSARLIWLVTVLWRILRRRDGVLQPPRVVFTFVGPHEEKIYRRRGWRRIASGDGQRQPLE